MSDLFPKFGHTWITQYMDEYCNKKNHVTKKSSRQKPTFVPTERKAYKRTLSATQPWLPKQKSINVALPESAQTKPMKASHYAPQQLRDPQIQPPHRECALTEEQRACIRSMERCEPSELPKARKEAREGLVDYKDKRTYSAPPPGVTYEPILPPNSAGYGSTKPTPHWIGWNTGPLEQPGLQKQLARPWPTPPPTGKRAKSSMAAAQLPTSPSKRCSSARVALSTNAPRAGTPGVVRPTARPSVKVPVGDNIVSSSYHDTQLASGEECFAKEPAAVDLKKHTQLNQLANFRSWDAPEGAVPTEDQMPIQVLQHLQNSGHKHKRKLFVHAINRERRDVLRTFKELQDVNASSTNYADYKRTSYDVYPTSYHQPRKMGREAQEPVNHDSFFMYTKPRIQGHFTIHPDWVSERSAVKKSAKHYTSSKGDKSFRYGST